MPATEQTRYNMRRLHKVFAVSSVLLTLVTVWLFARDHLREWKTIQRTSDRIEMRLAQWQQLQTLTDDMVSERERLRQALAELLSRPFSETILDAFCAEVRSDAERREAEPPSFQTLEESRLELDEVVAAAQRVRNTWQALRLEADKTRLQAEDAAVRNGNADAVSKLAAVARQTQSQLERAAKEMRIAQAAVVPVRENMLHVLESLIREAQFREDEWGRARKSEVAELVVDKARLGLSVRDQQSDAALMPLQDSIDQRQQRIDELTLAAEAATAHRERLQSLRAQLTADEESIRKRLDENDAESKRLEMLLAEKRSTYFNFWGIVPVPGKKWLELPILDAFNSPRKIENLWSDELDRPAGSFGRVPRFDRCTTCHQGIQDKLADSPAQPALANSSLIELALQVPDATSARTSRDNETTSEQLQSLFGITLAAEGLLHPADVTVQFVRPASVGRQARRWSDVGKVMRAGDIRAQWLHAEQGVSESDGVQGFLVGDIIVAIDGESAPRGADTRQWVVERLIDVALAEGDEPKKPLRVRVRRGLPQPFAGHSRLDLFVGENSPHRLADFACTVCHEGQGSATAFKWASHAPNDVETRQRWREQYGWFDNRHWIYPMHPQRFIESSCLKCHHDVVELERSERFPDAPAPKVTTGYRLLRSLGCFGCHEIQGFGSPQHRIGPDLRLEPNYYAAALQFKGAPGTGYETLTELEKTTVQRLVQSPEDEALREAVYALLREDASKAAAASRAAQLVARAGSEGASDTTADDKAPEEITDEDPAQPRFSEYVHDTLLPLLQPQETPGALRKVGPSLRFVRDKLDSTFLSDWIRQPSHFRPSTRMPQTFGLWTHLPAEQLRERRAALLAEQADNKLGAGSQSSRAAAQIETDLEAVETELGRIDEMEKRFEPIAIYSMVQYLQQRSQTYTPLEEPAGITPITTDEERQAQIERGGVAFQELGCLACHDHIDFPEIATFRDPDFVVEGPDLSDAAAKFAETRNPNGPQWLYRWITQPTLYSARTTMPDLMIEPVKHRDVAGNVTSVTDPVADIVAYLLSGSVGDWQPSDAIVEQLDEAGQGVLQELALVYLQDMFPQATARQYLQQGIPIAARSQLRGAERELIVTPEEQETLTAEQMTQRQLAYVAQKSFTTGGCFACHDIPGMEDAKPIGPSLNNWGRKDTGQLAFGHVVQYLQRAAVSASEVQAENARAKDAPGTDTSDGADGSSEATASSEYYRQQLEAQSRIGFIHQKLAEPRSFDYHEARNKKYTQRLQMPQFSLTERQREAVMTFVLGLVADPPSPKYVYAPAAGTKAILDGTEVLTKYSCRGCHVLETEKWQLAFAPGQFGERPTAASYPFVLEHFDNAQVKRSKSIDRQGLRQASVAGMPALSDDGMPLMFDDEEFPIEEEEDESFELDRLMFALDLWRPALVDGHPYQVGDGLLEVFAENLVGRQRSYGGALTKYLLPRVVEREKEVNPNAKGSEAWGWLPPVLAGEGVKVQPAWLHNYLLQPYPIRPAVVMRMPRYNLSAQEATKLVDYFAAVDQAEYPYNVEPVRQADHLAAADQQYAQRLAQLADAGTYALNGSPQGRHLSDAMQVVTDSNYCVKCHLIGDYDPPGIERVKAPDLARVHQRLRSDYVRRWLAKPTSVQPYSPMPVNVPFDPDAPLQGTTVPQELYQGTSTQQLEALVDLLMNFDRNSQQRSPVTPMVQPSSTAQ